MPRSIERFAIDPIVHKTVRLALISDTHIFESGERRIPEQVLALFWRAAVDRIVHAGDIVARKVIDQLAEIAPVIAVRGNNDHGAFGDTLPDLVEITIGRRIVRLVHGDGGRSARAVATEQARGAAAVIFGHSHLPLVEKSGPTFLVNPGSPCDRRWHPHFGVGFLEVSDTSIRPELVLFTDPAALESISVGWTLDR